MIPSAPWLATRGLSRGFIGVALLLSVSPTESAAAPPVRLLVSPAPERQPPEALQSPPARAMVCLARHVRGWLDCVPQVRLVDGHQAAALLAAATGPAWSRPAGSELAALAAFVPLDAVVLWEADQAGIVCRLQTRDGERRMSAAYPGPQALPTLLRNVTAFIARELALDPSAPSPEDWPEGDPKLVEDCLVAGSLGGGFMANAGTVRLDLLRPHAAAMPRSTAVAAAIADAARWLTFDSLPVANPDRYVPLAVIAVGSLIGSDREAEAVLLCRETTHGRGEIEGYLLGIIGAAGHDDLDALFAASLDAEGDEDAIAALEQSPTIAVLASTKTPAQQAGAIRCLGAMRSRPALPQMARIATADADSLRQAVATALGHYEGEDGLDTLARLADDAAPPVAFSAAVSLHRRGRAPPDLIARSRRRLAEVPGDPLALAVLAELGAAEDAARLEAGADDSRAERRRLAAVGLSRLGRAATDRVSTWLADPSAEVVEAALAGLSANATATHAADLRRLANHPLPAIATAARGGLVRLAPADAERRALFDLDVEHPYRRRRIVEDWARSGTSSAGDGLVLACGNALPEIRGLALTRLAGTAAKRLPQVLPGGLCDAHREVRLAAAAAAATTASAIPIATVEAALASESDPAVQAYLAMASARLTGRPPPEKAAVHKVHVATNQTFTCDLPTADSPYDGFYGLDAGTAADTAALRQAHAAGKIFLPRANRTAPSPALVFFNPIWRDGFWLGIEEELRNHLPWIDGVVIGEESMSWRRGDLWDAGWPLFCHEAGLEPAVIAGRWEALGAARQAAFHDWEERVQVEAFNTICERLKLRFGGLRPGFQVTTFLPQQHGPTGYDLEWQFDIVGGYDYAEPDNRRRYAAIRRFKTLWPDRPVIWLSQGRAGVGIALNDTVIRHTTPVPTSPWHTPHEVTAVDTLTAWQAGAHSGLFAKYLLVHHADRNPTTGVWVGLGNLVPGNATFERGIDRMFAGLAESHETRAGIAAAQPILDLDPGPSDDEIADLLEAPGDAGPHVRRAAAEKEALRRGLLLEGRLVQNSATVLATQPFPRPARTVLLVGPPAAGAPGFELATDFDVALDINLLERLPLDDIRFLGLTGQEHAAVRDETVAAVARWLETQPGLLYVHGWACDEPGRVAFRAGDDEAATRSRWPWSGEIVPKSAAGKTTAFDVSGGNAKPLGGSPADTVTLVLWQKPGWRGGVLFDGGGSSARGLGAILRRLHAEQGLGIAWQGTVGIQRSEVAGLVAVTSSRWADEPVDIPGVDVLTGVRNPRLPPGRTGVLTAGRSHGSRLAAADGIAVVSERLLEKVEEVPGGLRVRSFGMMQVVSERGAIEAATSTRALPSIADSELFDWLFAAGQPGLHRGRAGGPAGAPLVLLRAPGDVTLTIGEPPAD